MEQKTWNDVDHIWNSDYIVVVHWCNDRRQYLVCIADVRRTDCAGGSDGLVSSSVDTEVCERILDYEG